MPVIKHMSLVLIVALFLSFLYMLSTQEDVNTNQVLNSLFVLLGSILGGIISLVSLKINAKSKKNEMHLQLKLKLYEITYQEKSKIINSLLSELEDITRPDSISFVDEEMDYLTCILNSSNKIRYSISSFKTEYAKFMNNDLEESIWTLHRSLMEMMHCEGYSYNPTVNDFENTENACISCKNEINIVYQDILTLKSILQNEIKIDKQFA
ncbi:MULTISPECIES: hypothetical protein [Pectobacterium]|uniref:hypothetical protein n=1 Tax=Pectobacterium TaxID=122277 RepID=UPI000CD08492|nr:MULTISPECIES: hypothetical protein [Pectobacterium]MBA0175120.1 hypothetical protein [Pectobacterium carotovorum]POE00534.1 hypothetical protein BV916_20220 [Pectobacterium odoriferum]